VRGRAAADFPLRRRLLAGAAAFAAAELAAGLLIGGFFDWGRAEPLLFFAFRPWLLLIAALAAARFGWRSRLALYAVSLAGAGLSESLLIAGMGGEPWRDMVRGWGAGALAALAFDLLVQLGRRLGGRVGQSAAAAAGVLALVVPGATRPYEAVALGDTRSRPAASKPELLLMTGLPIIWGEAGPFDPGSRPAAAYRALQQEFAVRPVDYLDAGTLRTGRLMLLAQPRALEPVELVALDAWVRAGGRLLVLADPQLAWPTRLPPGDARRPPSSSLLRPLLEHWGLTLEPVGARQVTLAQVQDGAERRRMALAAPGRFVSRAPGCRVEWNGWLAACRIGRGRALLLADADLLHDALWTAPTAGGSERHARLADNPLVLAGLLDRLAGIERQRAARPVQWQAYAADRRFALLLAAVPLLLLAAAFAVAGRGRR
jgi:hypothetical protein